MKKQKFLTFFILIFTSFSVNASHCKYLSVKNAIQAFKDLAKYKTSKSLAIVDKYCEECGDSYVKPLVLEELKYQPHHVKGYASISINGEEVDLAYLYLEGKNLGHKYDCKTQSAPGLLFTENIVKEDS